MLARDDVCNILLREVQHAIYAGLPIVPHFTGSRLHRYWCTKKVLYSQSSYLPEGVNMFLSRSFVNFIRNRLFR